MYLNIRNHLFFILIPIIIVVGYFSFNRFLIKHDYIVSYEGTCDPIVSKCFVGCEDDSCTTKYFYSKIQKYAPDLYNQCGKDITDCEQANVCIPSDRVCSITYCNPEVDGDICSEILTEETINDTEFSSTEDNLLPINNKNL
jgi:hypothetical protein